MVTDSHAHRGTVSTLKLLSEKRVHLGLDLALLEAPPRDQSRNIREPAAQKLEILCVAVRWHLR